MSVSQFSLDRFIKFLDEGSGDFAAVRADLGAEIGCLNAEEVCELLWFDGVIGFEREAEFREPPRGSPGFVLHAPEGGECQ